MSRISYPCCILLLLAALPAQRGEKFTDPQVKREVVKDENGLQQWAPFKAQNCATCRGLKVHKCKHCDEVERGKTCFECKWTKKSPCRACGGQGRTPDPLLWVVCPGCHGAGCFPCDRCLNEGSFLIRGGSKKGAKCNACKALGAFKCQICKGKRLIPGPGLKPNVGEASLKDLVAAKQKIGQTLTLLQTFSPTGNTSKDLKAYGKALAPASKVLPPLKKAKPMIKTIQRGVAKGDGFVDNDQRRAQAFNRFRIYNQLYLKHQLQVIELCIKRAEFNDNLTGKKDVP